MGGLGDLDLSDKFFLGEKITPTGQSEFWFTGNKFTLTSYTMLKNICGMLNLQIPSVIYVGISEAGIVVGVELTQKDRDDVRIIWDNHITPRFVPHLIHSNIEIKFISLFKREENEQFLRVNDKYVIKLRLQPLENLLYTLRNGDSYIWRVDAPYLMSQKDVRDLALAREMDLYAAQIESFLNEIKKLSEEKKENKCEKE